MVGISKLEKFEIPNDYSTPEVETDLEQSEMMRILEQSIQQVDVSAANYETEDPLFGLDIPQDNSDPTTSTGTSINIFVRGVGVGLTHTR